MSQDNHHDASRIALRLPLIGLSAALLALAACGGSEPSTDGDNNAAEGTEDRAPGMINSCTLDANGTEALVPTPSPAGIQLVGGCDKSNPMSFTFYASVPQADDWFSLSFDTGEIVEGGETGRFELTELDWANGVFTPDNLPEGVNVKVPDQFSGTGTLDLTRHEASINSRRMVGTITGHVESENSDEAADLTAHFDINWSCAVF